MNIVWSDGGVMVEGVLIGIAIGYIVAYFHHKWRSR